MVKKIMLLAAGLVMVHGLADAQQKMNSGTPYSGIILPVSDGRIHANLRGKAFASDDVSKNLAVMLGLSPNHSFRKVAETTDKLGITHTDYQQYYQNVKVDNGLVLVHSKDGLVNSINGNVAQLGTLQVSPAITAQQALASAKKASLVISQFNQYPAGLVVAEVPADAGSAYVLAWKVRIDGLDAAKKMVMVNMFVDAATGKILNTVDLIADADVTGTAHTYYSGTRNFTIDSTGQSFRLRDNGRKIETYNGAGLDMNSAGYVSNVDYTHTSRNWDMFKMFTETKLQTGSDSILSGLGQNNKLAFELLKGATPATMDYASDLRWVYTSPSSNPPFITRSFFNLIDTQQMYAGAYHNLDNSPSSQFYSSAFYPLTDLSTGVHNWSDTSGNSGTYTIAMKKNPAVDVHWGMQKTYDFYSTVLNRNSYDGQGGVIKNYVDAGLRNNASASPSPYNFMKYGMGDGVYLGPVVNLDVMGHEFTHLVTGNNGHGGLIYQGQSGALNESFSDIFGTSVEFFSKGSEANWLIGDGVVLFAPGFMRSMANPKLGQNPDTYQGQYWVDPNDLQNDGGGVHTNSGVQNKWFYLLANGGTGTNDKGNAYQVPAIGIEKAEKIAYRNLTNYLTPSSNYMDAYEGSLEAVQDLFGNNTSSTEYKAVKEAWYAVGIGEKPSTAVNEIAVKDSDLKLYPNPATGRVTISSILNETLQAQIVNVVGVPVMNITVTKGLNPVDISGLAKGMYLIRYNTGSKGYVQKLSVL